MTVVFQKPEVPEVVCMKAESSELVVKAVVKDVKQTKPVKSPSVTDGRLVAPRDTKHGNVKQSEQKVPVRKISSTETKTKPSSQEQQHAVRYKPAHQTAPFKTVSLPQGRLKVPSSKSKTKNVISTKIMQPSCSEDQIRNCGDNTIQFDKLVDSGFVTQVDSDLCSESQKNDQVNVISLTDLHLSSESNCESVLIDGASTSAQSSKQGPSTGELFTLGMQGLVSVVIFMIF